MQLTRQTLLTRRFGDMNTGVSVTTQCVLHLCDVGENRHPVYTWGHFGYGLNCSERLVSILSIGCVADLEGWCRLLLYRGSSNDANYRPTICVQ